MIVSKEHAKARVVTNADSTPEAATSGVLVTNGIQTVVDETQPEQLISQKYHRLGIVLLHLVQSN